MPKQPRNAQDARNRAHTGKGRLPPRKTPLRASCAVFRRRRAPGRALAVEREALEKARAELEADRAEATELADKLAGDVEQLQSRLASIEAAEQAARIEAAEQAARIEADELRGQLTAATEQAHTAEARAVEIERRAGELRTELDRAHQDAEQARGALAEQQKATAAAAAQLDQVREELAGVRAKADAEREAHQEQKKAAAAEAHRTAERLTAAQGERDQARKEAGQAREEAARLAGQLDTLKEQSAALLARITPPAADQAKPTRKKPAE